MQKLGMIARNDRT